MTIRIRVDIEKFEDIVSVEDSMNFLNLTNREVYEYMIQFVLDEKDKYIPVENARKLFKKIPRKELGDYILKFMKAINEAYVSPTSGAD